VFGRTDGEMLQFWSESVGFRDASVASPPNL